MKKSLFTIFLLLVLVKLQAQNAYIQVIGEPGLSVFLNGQFKGKTTAELGGYIIENVTSGQNTIKIVKEGYAPFEEVVTVKPGEVLAYKVKPFAKHKVYISEQGTSQSTEEQVALVTGTLVIQSLPIEIKFTIREIEGVSDLYKTKDQWKAESVPEGIYTIDFMYNSKKITKVVEVSANETTTVFANMISGEITVKNSLDETRAAERELNALKRVMDSLCFVYKFKRNLTDTEFRSFNTEAAALLPWGGGQRTNWRAKTPGPFYYSLNNKKTKVDALTHILYGEVKADATAYAYYTRLVEHYKKVVPAKYFVYAGNYISFTYPGTRYEIKIEYFPSGGVYNEKYSYVEIIFYDFD